MKSRLLRHVGPILGMALFSGALWVLYHQLKAYHLHDVIRALENLPAERLLAASALTLLSYFIMTGYDTLALRYVCHPLAYRKTALASFISYAFSNSMGFGMIAGGSVRYRLYSNWGLTALEITKVVGFCSVTLWLGFLTLGGVVFLFEPMFLPETPHLPFQSVHSLGSIFLALVAAFVSWSMIFKKPIRVGEWHFSLPSGRLLLAQLIVATMDWALAGAVLYVLLPSVPTLSYAAFLGIYMLAQMGGLISQVPGGLGVFETITILLFSSLLPGSEILGALIAYRIVYYLIPLLIAALLLGTQEFLRLRGALGRVARGAGRLLSVLVPQVMALTTFVGGIILVFSGATPIVRGRLDWLRAFLPLPVLELSHFLGSLTGAGLLLLARSIQRRIDAAYVLTVILLGAGGLFSLLKGFDYEEAVILAIMLAALLPCRRYFYRKSSLLNQRFNAGWVAGVVVVIMCSVWLGLFSYKHVEYSGRLWWQFTFSGDAPRFLRAMAGVIGLASVFALARLLRPVPPSPAETLPQDLDRVVPVVQSSQRAYANLALLGDKAFLFSQKQNAFIMYGVEGRSWIAMGDPVGPEEEWTEMVWRFREAADRYDGWTVFYEVGAQHLHLYVDLGLTLLKLGEEALVLLQTFSLEGGARKGLRYTIRKLEKEGCTFEVVVEGEVPPLLPELKSISEAWLSEKHTREKGFSLGSFDEAYLKRFPAGIVRKDGRMLAFTNIWRGAQKAELSVDLMRYLPDAPQGVMEYLFIQLMLWGKREGYRHFNLGMAPFSGLEAHDLAPLWDRLGSFLFRHGEHFYNLQGLRQYKEKFDPKWEPRYLVCPGGLSVPRVLANISSLISGGMKGVVSR